MHLGVVEEMVNCTYEENTAIGRDRNIWEQSGHDQQAELGHVRWGGVWGEPGTKRPKGKQDQHSQMAGLFRNQSSSGQRWDMLAKITL